MCACRDGDGDIFFLAPCLLEVNKEHSRSAGSGPSGLFQNPEFSVDTASVEKERPWRCRERAPRNAPQSLLTHCLLCHNFKACLYPVHPPYVTLHLRFIGVFYLLFDFFITHPPSLRVSSFRPPFLSYHFQLTIYCYTFNKECNEGV